MRMKSAAATYSRTSTEGCVRSPACGQAWGQKKALDIGCAKGALVKALVDEGIDAVGVDVSEYAIGVSPVRSRLTWIDVQSEELPFPDDSFDLVVTLETVEHLEHPERLLKEAHRVLAPRGLFYLTTPAIKRPNDTDPTHINIRPQRAWKQLMQAIGFRRPSRAVWGAYRFASFRMQLDSPYEGRISRTLPIRKLGPLFAFALAAYRTQGLFRVGHPGTRLLATK